MRLDKHYQFYPLQNVVYFLTLLFWFVKYSHFTYMMCYYLKVQFQGKRVNIILLSTPRPFISFPTKCDCISLLCLTCLVPYPFRSLPLGTRIISVKRKHEKHPQRGLSTVFLYFFLLGPKYRVIHKSLRDFQSRLRNNQDRHGRKEHINR